MTDRTFAAWVKPIAQELREGRGDVVRTAEQLLPEHWTMPSPLEGWTYKDLLAHLATGDWVFQKMLRGVLGREEGLPAERGLSFVDDGNARLVGDRTKASVAELIGEVESEGRETQELLSSLSEEHEPSAVVWHRPDGEPITLGQWVMGFARHDGIHLEQLRTALSQVML